MEELGKEFLDGRKVNDLDGLRKRCSDKLGEVTKDIKYKIVVNDFTAASAHSKEVAEVLNEFDGSNIHYFSAFYEFESDCSNAIVTVVTKEQISNELAEIIVDLILNLGAEN